MKVPFLIGANTDEGTAFGAGKGPNGTGRNTTAEFLTALNDTGIAHSSLTAAIISYLYPDIQAIGIPTLTTLPEIITPNSADEIIIGPRRMANKAWSKFSVPNWSYRFDIIPNGNTPSGGATHFQEVAFVFNNTRGLGYATSPFANLTSTEEVTFGNLAVEMSRSWVSFITELDPNQMAFRALPIGGCTAMLWEGMRRTRILFG